MAVRSDEWAQWLLDSRDGGDAEQRQATRADLTVIRDRVLAGAGPLEGRRVLDVGAGDGLIGIEALERVGSEGVVVLSDISPPLLDVARAAARSRGRAERAQFVLADAKDLAPIPTESVDVVTARSVLIYVAAKTEALAAFHRVLRPGGRISLAEPVNAWMFPEPDNRFWGYDIAHVREIADKVKAAYERSDGAAATMHDFDARDLAELAAGAGFDRVRLTVLSEIDTGDSLMRATSLETLLRMAPNPLAPRLGEVIEASLTGDEAHRFLDHLHAAITHGACTLRWAMAFLAAEKRSAN